VAALVVGVLTPRILGAALLAAPLLLLGLGLGYRANRVLSRQWFERALIGIAVAGSLRLLVSCSAERAAWTAR
jgi:hypothetical protein